MNYGLLADHGDSGLTLNPRLLQYLRARQYYDMNKISVNSDTLNKQFGITNYDIKQINQYLNATNKRTQSVKESDMTKFSQPVNDPRDTLSKPTMKCSKDSCSNYASIQDFDMSLMGDKLNTKRSMDGPCFESNHPYTYNNESTKKNAYEFEDMSNNQCGKKQVDYQPGLVQTKGHVGGDSIDVESILKYGSTNKFQDKSKMQIEMKMDTANKWVDYQSTNCQKIPNVSHVQYQTTPFMGHGKGMGNVDTESTMWHAEPSRTAGNNDLGGISINRFDDLFVNVQEKSVFPFAFPRGGMNSRDPQLYTNNCGKII
jgi:hypothetical protein